MRLLLALEDTVDGERTASALSTWARDTSPEIHVFSVMNPSSIHETSRGGGSHIPSAQAVTTTGVAIELREPPLALAEDRSQAFVRARSERQDGLRNVAQKWFPTSTVVMHIEESKHPASAIVDAAHRLGVDLVAMGARDRNTLSVAVFGSVHEEVVRHSRVPVVVVGPAADSSQAV